LQSCKALCAITVAALYCSAASASDIHRVVTTLDANNKSTTLIDSVMPLEVGKSGNPGAILWITDSNPAGFSQEDTGKRPIGISPPDNGTVIRVVEFPPVDDAKIASQDRVHGSQFYDEGRRSQRAGARRSGD